MALGALVLAGSAIAYAWLRLEGGEPEILGPEPTVLGAGGQTLPIEVRDAGSGVRSLSAVLVHARGESPLLDESFPGSPWSGALQRGEHRATLQLDASALGVPDGEAFLRIQARDWSLRSNLSTLEVPVRIDRTPPRLAVSSGLTYVKRGGSGSVVYRVSEPPVRSGVEVGESFFPGFPLGGHYVAIFAVPTDAPEKPRVRVVAEDAAGNVAAAGWPAVVKERSFLRSAVRLPESFLEETVRGLAASQGIAEEDLSAAFRRINTELRAANERRIREIVSRTAEEPLWSGAFEQLENSQVTSRFAERRDYVVGGVVNSQATHFGYDLASTRAAEITATARGRVAFAGELGIYGQCVILDHGLGVASLYGHLSRIDVAEGESVPAGGGLGLSGASGLAGGDHLHFAILVGGTYVDPLEWWDPKWVETHVEARIRPEATRTADSRAQ